MTAAERNARPIFARAAPGLVRGHGPSPLWTVCAWQKGTDRISAEREVLRGGEAIRVIVSRPLSGHALVQPSRKGQESRRKRRFRGGR